MKQKLYPSTHFLIYTFIHLLIYAFTLVLFILATPSFALNPEEILVIANRNASKSVSLAKYYMKKRGIPQGNLLKLWVTDKEYCSRKEYEKRIASPVRRYLEQHPLIRCLVMMYGMPLKIGPPQMSPKERQQLKKLEQEKNKIAQKLKGFTKEQKKYQDLKKKLVEIKKQISFLKKRHNSQRASLDSEIALVKVEDYPLAGWIPNPYFLIFREKKLPFKASQVLMVSRLDGPSDKVVKRIINDSLYAEKNGLKGIAYFDARWKNPGNKSNKKISGYSFYDRSIHRAAKIIREKKIMPVVIEDTQKLFQPGQCPKAALYCGWYCLAHYIDAFKWQPGSIGYHIASGECQTLKRKESQVWCKMMLEKDISATIGPVTEPYVQAFPLPEIFFGCLVSGQLTLAECYFISLPYLSWQMVLVGDPLYLPFREKAMLLKRQTKH